MPPKRGRPPGKNTPYKSTLKTTPSKPILKPPPPQKQSDDEDDDDRSSDSDFNAEVLVAEESDASASVSEEGEDAETIDDSKGKRKRAVKADTSRKRTKADSEELDEGDKPTKGKKRRPREKGKVTFADLDSGDEVTINSGPRNSQRGARVGIVIDEDEEGGEGGWVKTRSQRLLEVEDDRPLQTTEGATINVDEVWARLAALPIGRPPDIVQEVSAEDDADYITIKRTIRFAGEVTTQEKRVHKHSAEAKLYLEEQENQKIAESDADATQDKNNATDHDGPQIKLRRPLKRLSRFEANPTGEVKSLPPHLQLRWPRTKTAEMANADRSKFTGPKGLEPAKINTVDKSRQDWAGYVDKAGIGEELDKYGKSKATYLGRQEFLNRAENNLENERREARQKLG